MRQNKLAIIISLIIAGLILNGWCFLKYKEVLSAKRDKLETASRMQLVACDCEQLSCCKTKERLFSRAEMKKELRRILLESHVDNVKIKRLARDILEIKFQSDEESNIYNCVENLYAQLPGIVNFVSIKIRPLNDDKIAAICKMKVYRPDIDKNDIAIDISNNSREHVNLFATKEHYKLTGVVEDQSACVNSKWYKIGDLIDEFQIVKIHHSCIELKQGRSQLIIPIGGVW